MVAVFLVIGGLVSGFSIFSTKAEIAEIASVRRNAQFLISTAQGAENAATLFGARTLSPVVAVSDDSAMDLMATFSPTLGAVRSNDAFAGAAPNQAATTSESAYTSSLSR